MAESHKFKDLNSLTEVFPDVPWSSNLTGDVWVYNEKEDENTKVEKGQYVVKIADRYEVHDDEPAKAKPAEASADDKPAKAEKDAPEVQPDSQTVNPEKLGTKEDK